jgi:hypothetical protein
MWQRTFSSAFLLFTFVTPETMERTVKLLAALAGDFAQHREAARAAPNGQAHQFLLSLNAIP